LLGVGVVAGCAVSVKWTGLGFVVVVLLVELLALGAARVDRSLGRIAIIMGMAAVVYVATFAVHFSLQTKQGPGAPFHTPSFQANLAGNPHQRDASIAPMGFVGRLIEANQVMWRANATMTATHPYASKWYSWPFMYRSIYMWNQRSGAGEARIYLIGNPVVWWLSAYAVFFLLINLPVRVGSLARDAFAGDPRAVREALITAGLVVNLLPFAVIGRPMFLYHYLPTLLFAVLAAGHFFDRLSLGRWCVFGALVVAAAVFFYFAPLTYGWPLTDLEHQRRLWLDSWR
jgi:dolichyl-phosphate-mannose-protein mannosyltransferase